jgi:N-acyl-D-glutamate deacylase
MAFYSFPLHLLRLVKQRRDDGRPVLSLGRAVHRVTGEIADYRGIDAGRLAVGARADIAVVDPEALDDRVDEVVEAPMPGMPELQRLVNRTDGAVRAVLINGRVAWDTGGRTDGFGHTPGFGRVLRSTRHTRGSAVASAAPPAAVSG